MASRTRITAHMLHPRNSPLNPPNPKKRKWIGTADDSSLTQKELFGMLICHNLYLGELKYFLWKFYSLYYPLQHRCVIRFYSRVLESFDEIIVKDDVALNLAIINFLTELRERKLTFVYFDNAPQRMSYGVGKNRHIITGWYEIVIYFPYFHDF